jgi:murein DD-endopeptidase MepM/ murein hydrolase activator NlpD
MQHRRTSAGRLTGRSLRTALVGVLAAVALVSGAVPAGATPRNPSDEEIGAAQSEQEKAAAEVGRIAALVAGAEAELERVGVQAEAAGTAYLAAEEALLAAQAAAEQTAAELEAAQAAVVAAQARIADFSRDSYMNGSNLSASAALLDAEGPGELIQRAALLDYVADNQLDVLGQLEVARIHQANADSAARKARDEMAAAEESARAAKQAADAQLAAQQAAYEQVSAQKADYDRQLQEAQIHLLELQGARNAYQQWVAEQQAAEAAARAEAERAAREAAAAAQAAADRDNAAGGGGGTPPSASNYVFPTSGWISSCYGWRWGALHGGVDVAAPVGTNIYAATSGIVARSGFANGFGLALYIRGDDGAVTVYGHVNREFVSAGERVHAGQLIAEVGNRGNSTGPHLHFEVHPSGVLHGGQVNPMPWLRARGVDVGGC